MLIGVCVALISTGHRRDRRIDRRLFRRLAGPGADVGGRPAAGGAQLHPDRDRHAADQATPATSLADRCLLAGFGWMVSSRMVRGMTMSLREREFVRAARYMGVPSWRIIIHHVVPNVASILIIDAALNVGGAILAETGLSFLGFGIQPPDVSLGTLIADSTQSATTFPWVFLFPAGVLVLILVCANVTGDGLRDALDPTSRAAAPHEPASGRHGPGGQLSYRGVAAEGGARHRLSCRRPRGGGDRRRIRIRQVGGGDGGGGSAPRLRQGPRIGPVAGQRADRSARRRDVAVSGATRSAWCSRTRCRR